ncbi:hypothetical protein GCM10010390_60560 [Streptomyces mordarskii]|uniref:Uncharacterized protein n=1 Tax=Streptomyces mordarskii TaxID=1226758 RepID=A0ABN1DRE4_9ACTN
MDGHAVTGASAGRAGAGEPLLPAPHPMMCWFRGIGWRDRSAPAALRPLSVPWSALYWVWVNPQPGPLAPAFLRADFDPGRPSPAPGPPEQVVTTRAMVTLPTPSSAPVRRRLFCHNLANPPRSLPRRPTTGKSIRERPIPVGFRGTAR